MMRSSAKCTTKVRSPTRTRAWPGPPPMRPAAAAGFGSCTRSAIRSRSAPGKLARQCGSTCCAVPGQPKACLGRSARRCAERMDLAVGEEIVEVLVVRPRHEVIVAPGHDLGGRVNRWQQVPQNWVLLGVMPYEPGRLREAPEVVGADVVLVDVGLAVAGGTRLDRVADVGSGVQPAHDVQTRRLDDLLE